MSVNNLLNQYKIKEEIVVFLRNSDIISTSTRGVTTRTDTGSFSDDNKYTVSNNPTLIKNVRSIEVDETILNFGDDYRVNYETGQIKFANAQTGDFQIVYDEGNSDKIFTDIPKTNISLSSYPRISVQVTSARTDEIALGGKDTMTDFLISIYVYAKGTRNVDTYIESVREYILNNKKSFYYLVFLTPQTNSSVINEPARHNKINTQVLELRAPLNIETVS